MNLVKGPLIALAIIFLLNSAQLMLSGEGEDAFAFNFRQLDHRVTLVFSFVFGYYSRVARHVLNNIVQGLFPRAWAEAFDTFTIEPDIGEVVIGDSILFNTAPKTEVLWAASLGDIDATGKYNAPKDPVYCGSRVVITAVSQGARSMTQSVTITLVPFKILGLAEVDRGSKYTYKVSTSETDVIWSVSPSTGKDINRDTGEYVVPMSNELPDTEVTLTVRKKKRVKTPEGITKECGNSIKIALSEG